MAFPWHPLRLLMRILIALVALRVLVLLPRQGLVSLRRTGDSNCRPLSACCSVLRLACFMFFVFDFVYVEEHEGYHMICALRH